MNDADYNRKYDDTIENFDSDLLHDELDNIDNVGGGNDDVTIIEESVGGDGDVTIHM